MQEVFAFVCDLRNGPRWRHGLLESEQTSDGPMGVGATAREVIEVWGRRIELNFEVTEFEVNRRRVLRSTSGPVLWRLTETYQPVAGGTRVAIEGQAAVAGLTGLAEAIFGRSLRRRIEMETNNLKEILEAKGSQTFLGARFPKSDSETKPQEVER